MQRTRATWIFGVGLVGTLACASQVPISEGLGQKSGALGAVGEAPKGDGTCDTRLTPCGGICRDLSSDSAHCGVCGNSCGVAESCVSAACSLPPPPANDASPPPTQDAGPCGSGESLCSGACIDVLFDNANCGACGATCSNGTKCMRGICT